MKIQKSCDKPANMKPLSEIKVGDVFRYQGVIYIRVKGGTSDSNVFNIHANVLATFTGSSTEGYELLPNAFLVTGETS